MTLRENQDRIFDALMSLGSQASPELTKKLIHLFDLKFPTNDTLKTSSLAINISPTKQNHLAEITEERKISDY